MNVWAVVPAAGSGERLGGEVPKAMRSVAGRSLIEWTILALRESHCVDGIVVAGPEQLSAHLGGNETVLVAGGASRRESVYKGLFAVAPDATHVLVHDAARPLVTTALVQAVTAALKKFDAVVPALPSTDTMKLVENDVIRETIPRENVWRAQTPQGFRVSVLREAHDRAREEGFEGTDDASLVERLGIHPAVVPGDHTNIKITTPEDLEFAEAIMRGRR